MDCACRTHRRSKRSYAQLDQRCIGNVWSLAQHADCDCRSRRLETPNHLAINHLAINLLAMNHLAMTAPVWHGISGARL